MGFPSGRDIFAGTLASGVFRTTGFNDGWERKITGMTSLRVWDLAVSPNYVSDGTVLAATDEGLFVSTDRGETWDLVAGIPSARVVAFSPAFATDATAFAADAAAEPTVYASFDGFQTWSPLGSALPQGAVLDLAPSPLYGRWRRVCGNLVIRPLPAHDRRLTDGRFRLSFRSSA